MAVERRGFGPIRAYRLDPRDTAPVAFASRINRAVALEGYGLSSEKLQAGGVLTVTLYWVADGAIVEEYTVFAHLVDEADQMWGQHDGQPLMGAYPTSRWSEALLLPDPHTLVISPVSPPGRYHLLVGLYRWPSLKRLPAYGPDGTRWPDDRIVLTEVDITG